MIKPHSLIFHKLKLQNPEYLEIAGPNLAELCRFKKRIRRKYPEKEYEDLLELFWINEQNLKVIQVYSIFNNAGISGYSRPNFEIIRNYI